MKIQQYVVSVLIVLGLALSSAPARSQVTVVVDGDEALAEINILGLGADFALRFDQPQNLTPQSLGLKVKLINLFDPAFRARLPDRTRTSIPIVIPLMISVEPPAARGLSFRNETEVELHTHLLPFHVDSPIRLYKASAGGRFHDITDNISAGSIRVRGRTGGFSDFILVIDLLPKREAAEDKYAFLSDMLLEVTDAGVRAQLQADLVASRAAYDANNFVGAHSALNTFETRVRANAGTTIPNLWRAQRDVENVAGELLTEAGSLRYVLVRLGG